MRERERSRIISVTGVKGNSCVCERERKEEDILPEKLQEENESYMEVCVGGSALVLWVVLMTTLTCIESS